MPQRWFRDLIIWAMLILSASISSHAVEAPLKKVAFGIDWFVNPDHGPLIVMLEKGILPMPVPMSRWYWTASSTGVWPKRNLQESQN